MLDTGAIKQMSVPMDVRPMGFTTTCFNLMSCHCSVVGINRSSKHWRPIYGAMQPIEPMESLDPLEPLEPIKSTEPETSFDT